MPLYKFKEGDVLRNRIKAYPKNSFLITSGSIFYNRLNINNKNHKKNIIFYLIIFVPSDTSGINSSMF